MRAVLLLLALALMTWVLFFKGSAGPEVGLGDGRYQRLELRHASPQPPARLESVAAFVPAPGLPGWEVAAPRFGYTTVKPLRQDFDQDRDEREQRIPGLRLEGEGLKVVRIPGRYDSHGFNQVLLQLATYGGQPEPVRVGFELDGRLVLAGPWLSLPAVEFGFASLVPVPLPQARRSGGSFDALRVEFRGTNDLSSLSRIELLRTDLSAFLPSPPGGLVTIDGEERLGAGLSSHAPLVGEFQVPPDGELAFSYGLDERLRVHGEQPRLTLTLAAEGVEPREERYDLESRRNQRARWHSKRLSLAEWAGKRVRATFALAVAGDHEGLAVVAEAAVSRRGEDAATVVLVTSDTHRGDHLGIRGGPVRTPVLDELARRGVLFENTLAATNVTNPSHVALMTATSPRDTHILNNTTPLVGRAETLAERFAQAGYRAFAAVSAYHLRHEESGLGQGFDRMNGPLKSERDGAETLDVLERWLVEAAGQPLFVWLHLFDAHAPYGPPGEYARRYWDGADPYDLGAEADLPPIELPPFLRGLRDKDYPYAMYRGEVDYVDQLMGRLLRSERIAGGILAFTADHGESFGEHGVWWDHAELFPETIQVPLILAWPGAPAGARSAAPVEMIDLGRTLLDLAGLEDAPFPGRDLRWALDRPSATQARFSIAAHGFAVSVQSGDWALTLHLRKHHEWALEQPREAHEVELYDLSVDPGCLTNLAKQPAHRERARRLRERLIQWVNEAAPQGLGTSRILPQETIIGLQDLGYTGTEDHGPAAFEPDPQNPWDAYFDR